MGGTCIIDPFTSRAGYDGNPFGRAFEEHFVNLRTYDFTRKIYRSFSSLFGFSGGGFFLLALLLFETGKRTLLFFNKGTEEKLAPETRSVASIYTHMPVHTGTAVIM